MTHKYVADLFSGRGGVAKACRQLGLRTREWELDAGEVFDLVRLPVRQKLKQDIRQGRVVSVMLAPPCMSFSAARDRTSVIRDKDLPWGRLDASDKDVQKMILGNQCMVAALDIIKECMKAGVPWSTQQVRRHGICLSSFFGPSMRGPQPSPSISAS